jgi:hypothetical protein
MKQARVREGRVREKEEHNVRKHRNENMSEVTASDLKAVAQDMLRMGTHWAQAAQGWLDQRRARGFETRDDRDIQSDFSGGGYDQVGRGASGAGVGRAYGYRGVGPRNYTRSDERIREDLNERLTDADDLDASGITVEVKGGIATLGGNVAQRWMKHRAEDLADGCCGVRDVRNQIQVGDSTDSHGTATAKESSSPH